MQEQYLKFSVVAEKLVHRIKEYILFKKMSMRKFDLSVGASDGYIQSAVKNNGSVGSDLIERIIGTYTDLNPYWLLTGEGPMLRSNSEVMFAEEEKTDLSTDYFELALLKYLDKPRVKEKIKNLLKDEEGEKVN